MEELKTMVEEEKMEQLELVDPLEIIKEEDTVKVARQQIGKVDVLVCGECHEVFHFIEEFENHRNENKCPKQSVLSKTVQNDEHTKIWGFMLWKNSKFKTSETVDADHPSSWNMYQVWCNLEQSLKDSWVAAGKSLQNINAIATSKNVTKKKDDDDMDDSESRTENEQDPLADSESDMDIDDPLNKSKVKGDKVENGGLRKIAKSIIYKGTAFKKGLRTESGSQKVEYIVEKIVSKRYNPGKKTHEYLVKWQNFSDDQNTWEPLANLEKSKELVDEFDKNLAQLKAAKMAKASLVPRRPYRKHLPERTPELILPSTGPGRPQRSSKQKALNQVKAWCGNISDVDENVSGKRPYSDSDSDSFEKKMKLEEESSDSDDDRSPIAVRKVLKSSFNGLGKKPLPSNILVPDAQGIVRIDQKQLPALSSGVYVMSKTAGIIKLDSNTSRIATSGGHAVIKVAPKIGQTSIKVIKRDSTNGSKPTILNSKFKPGMKPLGAKVIAHRRPATVTTIIKKAPEPPRVVESRIDDDESDGLEELPFPTDLPLPEPDSPPGEFTLCPLTGKIVGKEYPVEDETIKRDMDTTPANSSIDNLVNLAAADILGEAQEIKMEVDAGNVKLEEIRQITDDEKTQSIEATLTAMHADDVVTTSSTPNPPSTSISKSSILSTAISNANIDASPTVSKKETPSEIARQKSAMTRSIISRTIVPKPSPQAIITRITPGNVHRKVMPKSKVSTPPKSSFIKTPLRQTYSNKNSNVIRKIGSTRVYQSPKEVVHRPQPELQPSSAMNMPLLTDLPSTSAMQPEVTSIIEPQIEQDINPITLGDGDAPLLITGEDGTIYQVAGQNEDGQTILIAQDADGQRQCLLVTSESATELTDSSALAAEPQIVEPEPAVNTVEPESDGTEDSQIVAQIVSAQPPSPGGTRKVVLMLPDGNLMMTEVTAEQYAALELDK